MFQTIIAAFYLILPAYIANMMPVLFAHAQWLEGLAQPVDGGRRLGAQTIFGPHKTWRGLIVGTVFGFIIVLIQAWLYQYSFFRSISVVDYQAVLIPLGLLAGTSALLGDLVKSFFKRRINIASGDSWPIVDQLDFVVGFLIMTYWLINPSWSVIFAVIIMTLILHPLTNISAYFFHLKKVWW